MGNRGTRTRYPGVFLITGTDYLIRAKTTDLRTGRKKEVERLIREVSVREAPFAEMSRPSAFASARVGRLLKTRALFSMATTRVGVA